MTEFEQGVLYAAGILTALHDQPTLAASIVIEAGLSGVDCGGMPEYDRVNLRLLNEQSGIDLKGL